jgi:uncharacterized low-complexity protein
MKKLTLLVALASALALGAVTASFAQETDGNYSTQYQHAPYANGSSQYAPNYGNNGAESSPGDY